MEPDLREIYRLEKENNKMLRSLKRQAFWGGLFKLVLFLLALGVPIWLYFTYLAPVVKQIEATVTTATGRKAELEGQLSEWMALLDQFKEKMQSASGQAQ